MPEGIEGLTPAQVAAVRLNEILRKDPEVWRQTQRLAKKADPTLRIPEVELEDSLAASRAENERKIAEQNERIITLEADRRREKERAQSAAEGLDPDEVETRIVEERKAGNAINHATMRKIMLLERQTADPTAGTVVHGSNPQGTPVELRPDGDWRKLQGNSLRRHSAKVAGEMINDLIKARRVAAR